MLGVRKWHTSDPTTTSTSSETFALSYMVSAPGVTSVQEDPRVWWREWPRTIFESTFGPQKQVRSAVFGVYLIAANTAKQYLLVCLMPSCQQVQTIRVARIPFLFSVCVWLLIEWLEIKPVCQFILWKMNILYLDVTYFSVWWLLSWGCLVLCGRCRMICHLHKSVGMWLCNHALWRFMA